MWQSAYIFEDRVIKVLRYLPNLVMKLHDTISKHIKTHHAKIEGDVDNLAHFKHKFQLRICLLDSSPPVLAKALPENQ